MFLIMLILTELPFLYIRKVRMTGFHFKGNGPSIMRDTLGCMEVYLCEKAPDRRECDVAVSSLRFGLALMSNSRGITAGIILAHGSSENWC